MKEKIKFGGVRFLELGFNGLKIQWWGQSTFEGSIKGAFLMNCYHPISLLHFILQNQFQPCVNCNSKEIKVLQTWSDTIFSSSCKVDSDTGKWCCFM